MAIKLTSTKRDVHWVKMLVYGRSGIGKTFMCGMTAPNPIIISAEKGLLSLADVDVPTIEVESVQDIKDSLAFVKKNSDDYETVCVDSMSEIAEKLLIEYKKGTKDVRQAYGKMADDMATIVRLFRDLPNKHVIFTAKEKKEVDEGTGKVSYVAMIPGKSFAINAPYFFDLVACMRVKKVDGVNVRYLQTQPSVQYDAKDRSGKLDAMEEVNIQHIINKITGVK